MSTLASPKPMTADELAELPDDGFSYELVKGELRRMAPAGGEHGASAMNIGAPLKVYVDAHDLGIVFAAETGFQLTEAPDSVRAPDVSFVSRERIPAGGIPKSYWKGAPDLAIEVVSPHDKLYEIDEKIDEYLAAGTRVVCVAYPKRRIVTVHRTGREPQVLTAADVLELDDIVPGFRLPVAKIFV